MLAAERRRRGGARGTAYALGIKRCQGNNCSFGSGLHRQLFSVSMNEIKYLSCYPLGSRILSDGMGGVWIHREIDQSSVMWELLHKNRNRETEKFRIHREAKIVSDGCGNVWAMSPNDDSSCLELTHFTHNSQNHVASVPLTSQIFPGRDGNTWIYVRDDSHTLSASDTISPGLWIVSSHSHERVMNSVDDFHKSCFDPDGFGNIWCLVSNHDGEGVLLRRFFTGCYNEEAPFQFSHGAELHGCDSSNGVFVLSSENEPPEGDSNMGQLFFIYKNPQTDLWERNFIGDCPLNVKIASDGNGGLWIMMDSFLDVDCGIWRANDAGIQRVHDWTLSFESAELIGG